MRNKEDRMQTTKNDPEHCNNCGSIEYTDLYGCEGEELEGYTDCCNKRICYESDLATHLGGK